MKIDDAGTVGEVEKQEAQVQIVKDDKGYYIRCHDETGWYDSLAITKEELKELKELLNKRSDL